MSTWVFSTIVILAGLVAGPALGQTSRYTELVGPSCWFISGDPRPGDVKPYTPRLR